MKQLRLSSISEIIDSLPGRLRSCRWFDVLFALLAASGSAIAFESLKTTFPVIANSFSDNQAASPLNEFNELFPGHWKSYVALGSSHLAVGLLLLVGSILGWIRKPAGIVLLQLVVLLMIPLALLHAKFEYAVESLSFDPNRKNSIAEFFLTLAGRTETAKQFVEEARQAAHQDHLQAICVFAVLSIALYVFVIYLLRKVSRETEFVGSKSDRRVAAV